MELYDVTNINNTIFKDGNVRTSPQHLKTLNNTSPTPFRPATGVNPEAGYQVFLTGYANYILEQEKKHRQSAELLASLNSLRSIPRPSVGGYKKAGSIDTRLYKTHSFNIWYKVNSGQVLIINIEPTDDLDKARAKAESVGLYKVRNMGGGEWEARKTTKIETSFAAVNGQSNSLAKAKWLMAQHLEFEFGPAASKEYTLFHNPSVGGAGDTWESIQDKLGFTTDVTKEFSKLLQDTQKKGKDVKWIAHSQGGAIFAEGVRYSLNGNSSWAILGGLNGKFKDKKSISLDKHSVAFHGNANNNFRSKFLFDRAGIKVLAAHGNDSDGVYNVIGMNAENSWNIIRSLVYWNHVTSGSVQQSPHTTMQTQEDWDKSMTLGPGKGRNAFQKKFESAEKFLITHNVMGYIPNFLK